MDKSKLSDRERLAPIIKSTNQRRVIIDMVNENGWKRGAEIGVLKGKTLFSVLFACPDLYMYGVDMWKQLPFKDVDCSETYKQFDMNKIFNDVQRQSIEFGLRCLLIRDDSVSAVSRIDDASLDFVFIDADHTYQGVKRDVEAWWPKIKSGGKMLGHDNHWPTVRQFINERFKNQWVDCDEAVWSVDVP